MTINYRIGALGYFAHPAVTPHFREVQIDYLLAVVFAREQRPR